VPLSLRARIVGYEALGDFIPIYQLYALLFSDHGLSAAEISSLFVIWSVTGFVLEVPSGAWADTFSRRKLLILAALIEGAGFAMWVVAPSYAGFVLGFLLWGTGSALASGTFEAFAYDELAARDATDLYAGLLGQAKAAALVLVLLSSVIATPLYQLGGYELVGWASVAACVVQAALARSLPETPRVATADETEDETTAGGPIGRYLGMLRSGLAEVTRTRAVRGTVVVVAVLMGFQAFDEYYPLMARETGARTDLIPLLLAVSVAAEAVGHALAGRAARLRARLLALLVVGAAVLLATGALSGHWAGFGPIALGYGMLAMLITVTEARLQDAIEGPARATITSVSGLLAEAGAVTIYLVVAVGTAWTSIAVLLAVLCGPLLVVAALLPRWLPAPVLDSEHA
jgi:MFS family permease